MNQANRFKCLNLDSHHVSIPFSKTKTEIVRLMQENGVPLDASSEARLSVSSCLWSLGSAFLIVFHFRGERLTAITLSPEKALEGGALFARYEVIQKAMEAEYGRPRHPLQTILNVLDPDHPSSRWHRDGVRIEHFLLDRFGMEERIRILL